MKYYVSNKPGELGKKVEADSPEAAAAKSKMKGNLDVRWDVKFGEPGRPASSGSWWFANTLTVREAKPKAAPKKTTTKKTTTKKTTTKKAMGSKAGDSA